MKAAARKFVRRFLRRRGLDLVSWHPIHHPLARRLQLLDAYKVDCVLDAGANIGQYALQLREMGYRGRIVSFEPVREAYDQLAAAGLRDPHWEAVKLGLGDEEGELEINVANNLQSSSLLDMLPVHQEHAPESAYAYRETVQVRRLDSVFDELVGAGRNVFLKIDTQGFERKILEGATNSMGRIVGVQIELSLLPMYEGESGFREMLDLMDDLGFVLMSFEPTFGNEQTGQLLQFDGVFFKPAVPPDGHV